MSFKILYEDLGGTKATILKILERKEYFSLTDKEKKEYLASPGTSKDYDPLYTGRVLSFIDEMTTNVAAEAWGALEKAKTSQEIERLVEITDWRNTSLEEFVHNEFPNIWENAYSDYPKGYGRREERFNFFWNFLSSNKEYELKFYLFITNKFYKDDIFYEYLIEECKDIKV